MTWQTTLTINNNTAYNITVTHNNIGDLTTIEPNSFWSNTDQESTPNNTNALKFWQQPNVWFMQGSVSFGPTAGVYVDRGWMDPNAQTIKMTANANGKEWVQTQNGGETLLAWNEFEQGGTITLTFDTE
jgi:hypothetical protein